MWIPCDPRPGLPASRIQKLRALTCGLLLLGLAACGGSVEANGHVDPTSGHGGPTLGLSHIVQSIERAPWTVPYEGIRHIQYLDESPTLSYREKVAGDGQGGFQLVLEEMLSSHPSLNGIAQRLEQTKGFRYRYKDFRIQNAYLFQIAYRVRVLNKDEMVAGVPCTRILVEGKPGRSEHPPGGAGQSLPGGL